MWQITIPEIFTYTVYSDIALNDFQFSVNKSKTIPGIGEWLKAFEHPDPTTKIFFYS